MSRRLVTQSRGSPPSAGAHYTRASACPTARLAIFDSSDAPITLEGVAGKGATFVLGSAVPHPYPLHVGSYSVHTSSEALAAGERHIRVLRLRLDTAGACGVTSSC